MKGKYEPPVAGPLPFLGFTGMLIISTSEEAPVKIEPGPDKQSQQTGEEVTPPGLTQVKGRQRHAAKAALQPAPTDGYNFDLEKKLDLLWGLWRQQYSRPSK